MDETEPVIVKSVSEFVDYIESRSTKDRGKGLNFRGQSSANRELVPSVQRIIKIAEDT